MKYFLCMVYEDNSLRAMTLDQLENHQLGELLSIVHKSNNKKDIVRQSIMRLKRDPECKFINTIK